MSGPTASRMASTQTTDSVTILRPGRGGAGAIGIALTAVHFCSTAARVRSPNRCGSDAGVKHVSSTQMKVRPGTVSDATAQQVMAPYPVDLADYVP